jgi:hypothetical protein
MQPKKQASVRGALPGSIGRKEHAEPHRPAGLQAMGPALYEQVRQAVRQLGPVTRR